MRLVSVLDLGATPPRESFLSAEQLDDPEPTRCMSGSVKTAYRERIPKTRIRYPFRGLCPSGRTSGDRCFRAGGKADQQGPSLLPSGANWASWQAISDDEVPHHSSGRRAMLG
jgi:hypothetical protein